MTTHQPQPQTHPPPQQQPMVEPLSPKEVEVLYLLFNPELDQSDIARQLSITRTTVSFHTINIYSKLQVSSRFEAICKYAQLNSDYRQAFFDFLQAQNQAA